MQRHEALADLSRDHHRGLVWAKRLSDAAEDEAEATAEAFVAFWDDELAAHVTEEEHVLLPIYQRHVDLTEDELVLTMLADHAWFRDRVPDLRTRSREGQPLGEALAELGRRLHDHARMEDRELFGRIEETLAEDELAEVHDRSRRFRRAHRGEGAIGPRPTRED
ncbi:hypothetical protein BRD56_01250 [Thermoplasmatales archaeon SW_10_69_26]|nr:MAG: hypothetical protein BRD56_01250 [Thermoplasmatales archaeon SW_10_69_26]